MTTTLHRVTLQPDLEIRAKGDGRTIHGLAVPFDTPTLINNRLEGKFWETFRKGAFARTITSGKTLPLNLLHDRTSRLPIGVATVTREDARGLYQEFRVSETATGEEALALIRDGVPLGLSIGFSPDEDRWSADRDAVERLAVALNETSLVNVPAYESALVEGVRFADFVTPEPDNQEHDPDPEPTITIVDDAGSESHVPSDDGTPPNNGESPRDRRYELVDASRNRYSRLEKDSRKWSTPSNRR